MERRDFLQAIIPVSAMAAAIPSYAVGQMNNPFVQDDDALRLYPNNIQQLIKNIVDVDHKKVNSDWDGSIKMEALLGVANKGYSKGIQYVQQWFQYRMDNDKHMSDEEFNKLYDGNKARIVREGPLVFSIYSAMLGVAFPIHELYKVNKDKNARQVCFDVANAILHYASRDKFGMLAHDDSNFEAFAIPDTAYWATRATAIAASLSKGDLAQVYWKQSIFQLNQGIQYFYDNQLGIVRTGLFKGKPSVTYWCRSQGWLMWAIAGLLRYLPSTHPQFNQFAKTLDSIANGLQKYQSSNGALHVLVNDNSTPEEVTSTAMVVATIKEAMRKKWIPNKYDAFCNKAWEFIKGCVDANGKVTHAYTGWAVPAENHQVNLMDHKVYGYVPGIVLRAANEMVI